MMGEWIGRIERKFQDVLNKMTLTTASLTAIEGYVDGLETLIGTTNTSLTTLNAKDFATQATLAAVLAKIIAAPATEAKQDTQITSLASLVAKDYATETSLAALRGDVQVLITPSNTVIQTEFSDAVFATLVGAVDTYLAASSNRFISVHYYAGGIASLVHYAVVVERA